MEIFIFTVLFVLFVLIALYDNKNKKEGDSLLPKSVSSYVSKKKTSLENTAKDIVKEGKDIVKEGVRYQSDLDNINPSQGVVVFDIKMPFISMVVFMVKWAIASIPAFLILALIGYLMLALLK
jgi:hypothetical protein